MEIGPGKGRYLEKTLKAAIPERCAILPRDSPCNFFAHLTSREHVVTGIANPVVGAPVGERAPPYSHAHGFMGFFHVLDASSHIFLLHRRLRLT